MQALQINNIEKKLKQEVINQELKPHGQPKLHVTSSFFPQFLNYALLAFVTFIYSGLFFLLVNISPILLYAFYVIMGLLLLGYFSYNKESRGGLVWVMPYFMWSGFYFLWGTLVSPYIGVVVPEVFRMIFRTWLVLIAVSVMLSDRRKLQQFAKFIQVAAIFNALLSEWETLAPEAARNLAASLHSNFAKMADYRPAGLWGDPNEASFYLLLALLLSKWIKGPLAWAGRVASVVGVYLTVSRSGTYMLVIAALVYLIFKIKDFRFKLLNTAIFTTILTLLLSLSLFLMMSEETKLNSIPLEGQWKLARLMDFSESANKDNSEYSRSSLATIGINRALAYDWYGQGIFSYQEFKDLNLVDPNTMVNQVGVGAHNVYVAVLGETGYVGVFTYVLTLLYGASRILTVPLAKDDRLCLALLWGMYLWLGFSLHLSLSSFSLIIYVALLYHLPKILQSAEGSGPPAESESKRAKC